MARQLKILVADDSLSYRMTIQELLEDNQYEVVLAETGKTALDLAQRHPVDLIITDIMMPEVDGIELCHFIKSHEALQAIPVIMLTAKDESEDKIYGLETGADDYLTKPFNDEELLAKIQSLLRIKILHGELGHQEFSQESLVLVADDSLTVRMELSELIEEGGYKTLLAENGEEAIELVNRHLPDLAILDVVMPGMDGIEVCQNIKNNLATQQIPVVIITSKTDMDDKIRGLNAGADDYIFKPYHPHEFKAKIAAIFRTKKMQLETERNLLARKNFELQAVNEKLKETQTQMVQQEKMASLGQLVAGIAHEINNPLSYVISNTNICRKTLNDYHRLIDAYHQMIPSLENQESLKKVTAIEKEIDVDYLKKNLPPLYQDLEEGLERIRQIVLSLRSFSRLDEAEQKKADLIEGIESTINLISYQTKDQIKIIKKFQKLPEIVCFPGQLNQVFMNILVNAIQAIEKKGTITIQTSLEKEQVILEFSDNGKGISEEELPHIFEPFFTTKEVGHGTGLGLSISFGIIQQHEGCISYESELGKGTTCTIKLPIR